ncbi:MAG: hypothetical protein ABI295_07340 [Xanthomarina sp.]
MKVYSSIYKGLFTLIFLSFVACNSISVQDKPYKKTKKQIILGSIGQDANYLLEQHYSNSAIPNFTTPIKVQATAVSFRKSSIKSFQKAQAFQTHKVQIKYIDSIELKPRFLNLEIVDQVAFINMLNAKENMDIKQYLINQNKSHIITHVSVAFTESTIQDIQEAEEAFIELTGKKSIALHLYSNNKLIKVVGFFEGVVFAYKTASCCWKENSKHQLEIVDLVDGKNKCPNKSYLSAQKAIKKINYYKF